MRVHYFSIMLPESKWIRYYRGEVKMIQVTTTTGITVEISAHHFRRFTSQHGLYGFFKLTLDHNNRFLSLQQLV